MIEITLEKVPAQEVNVILNKQKVRIRVFQLSTGLYVDVYKNDEPVCLGVLALNLNKIVRYKYLDFDGDLFFMDTQGSSDPQYKGLGERFILCYDLQA